MTGKVKWFDNKKGYGFIVSGGTEYFAHHTEIQSKGFRTLNEGETVEFTPDKCQRGPKATKIYRGA